MPNLFIGLGAWQILFFSFFLFFFFMYHDYLSWYIFKKIESSFISLSINLVFNFSIFLVLNHQNLIIQILPHPFSQNLDFIRVFGRIRLYTCKSIISILNTPNSYVHFKFSVNKFIQSVKVQNNNNNNNNNGIPLFKYIFVHHIG